MILQELEKMDFDRAAKIAVSEIVFEPSLIDLCKLNTCGNYGKNYTCPPLVGKTEELVRRAKTYQTAVVFQKIYPLEDSFDIEGMGAARRRFRSVLEDVQTVCQNRLTDYLLLGAGGCSCCDRCAAQTDEPCRFPEKAIPSLEAYSINVSSLAAACGMRYINGTNTVTYFGAVLV
ncbi:MAG: DUF2284 domain-containing protein [Clostridia bacterium]|nr:DUF2284 domain-containing protein [Clostridia bacterium]